MSKTSSNKWRGNAVEKIATFKRRQLSRCIWMSIEIHQDLTMVKKIFFFEETCLLSKGCSTFRKRMPEKMIKRSSKCSSVTAVMTRVVSKRIVFAMNTKRKSNCNWQKQKKRQMCFSVSRKHATRKCERRPFYEC